MLGGHDMFQVQVIPWVLSDSNYIKSSSQKLDAKKTVFVGALHGMLNAEGLAKIMNDLFDGVLYAGEYERLNTAAMMNSDIFWNVALCSLGTSLLMFQKGTLPLS
jgi:hypothetical protein